MSLRFRSYVLMLAAALGINVMASQPVEAASILFGVAGGATSTLYTVNTATGAATAVGDIGFANVRGISFNPLDGLLYGVTNLPNQLITINTATGVGTLSRSITPAGSLLAADIAFDSAGTLFAWNETNLPNDQLATIDLATGALTNKGLSGLSSANDGLAFNGSTLYVKGGNILVTVNPATGIANVGSPINVVGDNLNVEALAFNAGVGYSLGHAGTGPLGLYVFNGPLNGVTRIGNTGVEGLDSLAFSPDAAAAVPEPTSLLLLGTGVGALVRRRRRSQQS